MNRTFARLLSTGFVGVLTLIAAARAGTIGVIIAVVTFALGAASVALGERWLGHPDQPRRVNPAWGSIGAAIAVGLGSAASGHGLADLPFMIAAGAGGFVTGLFLAVTLTGWGPAER